MLLPWLSKKIHGWIPAGSPAQVGVAVLQSEAASAARSFCLL